MHITGPTAGDRGDTRARLSTAMRQVVKVAATGCDALRARPPGLVILLYHRVGATTDSPVDLPDRVFSMQLDDVASRGTVDLDGALEHLCNPEPARIAEVAVTFDDGTADFVDHALPLLVGHRVPATLYLATRFVEEGAAYPDGARPLSWAGVREALSTGLITVGTHTHAHTLFDRVTPEAAAAELDRSIGLIADRLGVPAEHFAYPKALPSGPLVEAEVRRRVRSAALAGTHANRYGGTDVHRLARSPIGRADGMRWFRHKLDGGMAMEDTWRRWAGRRRYAGATT
jgi:peptidoglycan/xylan/chitin deacetylase (PgdA/CDA1 family)